MKIRRNSRFSGWWLLLALAIVFAAMLWTASMSSQNPFALAIMSGLTGLGYLLGAYIATRQADLILDSKGLFSRSLGRTLSWESIQKIERREREIGIDMLEGERAWRLHINLGNLRLNSKLQQKLDAWLEHEEGASNPMAKADCKGGVFNDYAAEQSWAGNSTVAAMLSLFMLIALLAISWTMPGVSLVFAPFGFIFGMLASMVLPWARAVTARANYHSLWISPARSIPWAAVAGIKLSDTRKNRIQIDLLGGRYEDGQGVLESPLFIDISKTADTGDEILRGLDRMYKPAADAVHGTAEYKPNAYTKWDLYFSAATVLVLVAWGGWGLWVDDLAVPTRRGTLHLHGSSAWLMYAAWLFAASSFVAIIVDHFDKRDNEKRYKRIGHFAVFGAWLLFFGSLSVSFVWRDPVRVQPCATKILKAVGSSEGERTAYAYVFECRDSPAEVVHVSVLPKGIAPSAGRGNVATVGWPNKFSDLRWEGEKLKLVHAYPWKLRPAKGSPVAIYGVPQ